MAEQDITAQDGATPLEPSQPAGDQSPLTVEELADAVQARIWPVFQSHTDKVAQGMATAIRKELSPYLEKGERTEALVRAIAKGAVLSEEQLEELDRAHVEQTRVAALSQQNAQLQEQVKGLEARGWDDARIDGYLVGHVVDRTVVYAREQGWTADKNDDRVWEQLKAEGLMPQERVSSKNDEFGTIRFERDMRANIRKAADAKLRAADPAPAVPSGRGNGPSQSDLSGFDLIQRGMAARGSSTAVPR